MSDEVAFQPKAYQSLLSSISNTYENGRLRAFQSVNICLIETYWTIGQHIVEFEQGGISRAEYGRQLLEILSRDLRQRYGKGFSRSNLTRFRQFYLAYPNCATLSHKLSCSRSHAPRGNAVKARCAASHGQRLRIRDAARPALHSHVARGNEGKRPNEIPALAQLQAEHGGKSRITMRVDSDTLAFFKARAEMTGSSYQTMMNEALKQFAQGITLADVVRETIRKELHS